MLSNSNDGYPIRRASPAPLACGRENRRKRRGIDPASLNNKMLTNTIILFTAMIITKLVGAMLKIPLTNILGGLGMGYFSTAQSLFSPVYAVTAAALPTVIMRLTAQNAASGKFRNINQIRRAGLFMAFGLGLTGCIGILIIAKPFSTYIADSPNSLPALLIIAPSLLFGSLSAVYRGYYEGLSNMLPTAISQIIEAIIKSSVGIFLAMMFMPMGIPYAAAAAMAGLTIAEFFSMLFLHLRTRFSKDISGNNAPPPSIAPTMQKRVIIKTIMNQSFPITLAALAMNLNPFIDMMTIPIITDEFTYGSYTGITMSIFALATSVTAMVCKSALPEITAAYERQNRTRLVSSLRLLFKGTFMVGLPICLGLSALAEPILSLLYFSRPDEVTVSTPPLIVLGLGGGALLLAGTLFGIFIAIGRADIQIKLMLIGAAVKYAGNQVLIRIPELGVTGAAISTVICYTVISIIGLIILKRLIKPKLNLVRNIIQPMTFALLCGSTAYACYYYAFTDRSEVLRLAMSVAAGALVYLVLTMFTDRRYIKHFLPVSNSIPE